MIGLALCIATPAACAVWPQRDTCPVSALEPELRSRLEAQGLTQVYFNKGL